jgi:DNA invertase Pin-like site-specific DNA recombinase
VFHLFGAVATLERDLILGRTMVGLEATMARQEGRTSACDGKRNIALVYKLMRDRETPVSAVCATVGVYRATLYRYVESDGTPRVRNQG